MNFKQKLFILLQYSIPHHSLSRLIGRLAECEAPWFKNRLVTWFAKRYQVDMSLAAQEDLTAFKNFNDFFTRELKPDARPIDDNPDSVVCPADGVISQIGSIKHGRIFQAKGHSFSANELLGGDSERSKEFKNGTFCTVYLSPKDYHRVHMPVSGTLREMIYVPGRLFSVNQTTAENVPELFARNERVVCIFDTDNGPMAVVLVGAMIVASIETVWAGLITPPTRELRAFSYRPEDRQPITLQKGDELGRFKLGSTAILLFAENKVDWLEEMKANCAVQMGQALGQRSQDLE